MSDSVAEPEIPIEIDVFSVKQLLDEQADLLLLDCRQPHEHEYCRIEGAKLIPLNETPERIGELASFREQRIVVYCHAGIRSFQVASWLRSQGFSKSQNMTGGIDQWSLKVDPDVPRY